MIHADPPIRGTTLSPSAFVSSYRFAALAVVRS